MSGEAALFDIIAAHCFWHCGHVERGSDPDEVHDGMERHYAEKHPEPRCRMHAHRPSDDTMHRCRRSIAHDGRHDFGCTS